MEEFYVTFGVKHSLHPESDRHPLRMQSRGYAVVEASDLEAAREIARETLNNQYAFIYDRAHFIDDGTAARWHHDGELMRIRSDGTWFYVNEEKLQ